MNLEDVDLQVDGARYSLGQNRLWRCSKVIYEGEEPYPKHIPAVRAAVRKRGKIGQAVHDAIETYLVGDKIKWDYLSNEETVLFKSWRDWYETLIMNVKFDLIKLELKVFHLPYLIGGRLDCLAKVGGKVNLFDWKTNPQLTREMIAAYFAQLNGYNLMLEYLRGQGYTLGDQPIPKVDKLKLIHIKPNGVYIHEELPNGRDFFMRYLGYLKSEEVGMVVLNQWLPRNKIYRWNGNMGRIYRRCKWGSLYYYHLHLMR